MTTIILYGEVAERFPAKWRLNVNTVGEALRAIDANCPGFMAYLSESTDRGVDFNVRDDGDELSTEQALRDRRVRGTIHISPVVRGSKSEWVTVVIGAVLIAAAIFVPGMQGFAWMANPAFGIAGGVSWAGMIGGMGVGLMLGGAAQMIAGHPKVSTGSTDDGGRPNDLFNGPENVTQQGGPVPLILGGPLLVGSTVVSAGIYTEDTGASGPYYNPQEPYEVDLWGVHLVVEPN